MTVHSAAQIPAQPLPPLRQVGDVDVIFAGRQAIDGDTAQVGPQVAQRLGLPVVTYVQDIKLGDGKAVVQRQLEDGYEIIEVQTPCLLTAVKELNQPRYMSIGGIVDAYKKEITVWDHNAVELDPKDCGLNASPTQVFLYTAAEGQRRDVKRNHSGNECGTC